MSFAQVLTTTVTVQDGRTGIAPESLNEGDVRQTTAVVGTELPAQYLTGCEVHNQRQVEQSRANTQVRKILYPCLGLLCHGSIVHTVLWTSAVLEQGVSMQMVTGCSNLWLAGITRVLFVWPVGGNAA